VGARLAVARGEGFGSFGHLVVRFAGSLVPAGPSKGSERWALSHLGPGEAALFSSLSGADRRHAVGVARRALRLAEGLGGAGDEEPAFVAAALLHDVGKADSGLGTFGRVWATLAALVLGRRRVTAWEGAGGLRSRIAAYLQHDRLGAERLAVAGSAAFTVSWAREHHLPEERWTVDRRLGRCLKDADGD